MKLYLLLFVFLSSCTIWGDSYTLWIDPAFTDDEIAQWKEAARRWQDSVPVQISTTPGVCNGAHDGLICTHASDAAHVSACGKVQGCTHRSFAINGGDIYIDVQAMRNATAELSFDTLYMFVHEMGHAQGLNHGGVNGAGVPGTAMFPTQDESSKGIVTCLDQAQWYEIRHMTTVCNAEYP